MEKIYLTSYTIKDKCGASCSFSHFFRSTELRDQMTKEYRNKYGNNNVEEVGTYRHSLICGMPDIQLKLGNELF